MNLSKLLKKISNSELTRVQWEIRHVRSSIESYSKSDSDALGLPEKLVELEKLESELSAKYTKEVEDFRNLARAEYRKATPEERKLMKVQFPVVDFEKSSIAE